MAWHAGAERNPRNRPDALRATPRECGGAEFPTRRLFSVTHSPKHRSTQAAAELLDVSDETVRRMILDGRLPASNIGTDERPRYRIPDHALQRFLRSRRVSA